MNEIAAEDCGECTLLGVDEEREQPAGISV